MRRKEASEKRRRVRKVARSICDKENGEKLGEKLVNLLETLDSKKMLKIQM